ncbi:MAG: GlsB/YeaQ/YmgE family stress response membrane protein [Rhodobacteraceae bacterium]|nr:GlsB/YeaQ/YmgE family stress response membrane protein [Paracoccaceae bacterium]
MSFIMLIIVGAAAGFIATRMMRIEANVFVTVAIGILGALLGGVVLRVLGSVLGMAFGFVGAVIGAALLIWIWQTYFKE